MLAKKLPTIQHFYNRYKVHDCSINEIDLQKKLKNCTVTETCLVFLSYTTMHFVAEITSTVLDNINTMQF